LHGDFDCDGRADTATLVQTRAAATVRVAFGGSRREPQTFYFRTQSRADNWICRLPVHLELESLDYDANSAAGPIEGFVRSKKCKGFALVDEACDSAHFYWNHARHRLDWWRA
jgi:hypothetical protein